MQKRRNIRVNHVRRVRQNGEYAEHVLHSSTVDPRFQSDAQLVVWPCEANLLDLHMAWRVAILIVSC